MNIIPKQHWGKGLITTIVLMSWMASSGLQAQSDRKRVGEVADLFELTNIRTGEAFDLSQAEGSIILLDFFFYW